jgi:homeobox-leucine zipper protein
MSSLTTAGSSMESCSAEFDTRLSLEMGETSRMPPPPQKQTTVRLFGELISPQKDHGDGRVDHREPWSPAAGGRKKRTESGVATVTSGGRHNKRAIRTSLQAEDDGDRRSPSDGGSRKKLRLTSAQASLLEDSFRAHNILSHVRFSSFQCTCSYTYYSIHVQLHICSLCKS